MVTLRSAKNALAKIGLELAVERSATCGYEFSVTKADGRVVASGWTDGSKGEAAVEAMQHPAVIAMTKAVA